MKPFNTIYIIFSCHVLFLVSTGCRTLSNMKNTKSTYQLTGVKIMDGQKFVYVAASDLNIRQKPSQASQICGTLPGDKKIKVLGINHTNWVKLVIDSDTNLQKYINPNCQITSLFVHSGYLSESINTDRTTTPSPSTIMQRQLKFTNACNDMDSSKFTLGFVGDVLLHMPLQNQAFSHEEQFKILWKEVQGLISQVDFMYANLEGPAAANIKNSSYPLFNYPEFILDNLVDSSFDIVSTVNNHTLDKGVLGVDRTIEGLRRVGLPYFGSIKSDEIEGSQFYTITNISNESDSIRVAWVGCTFSNNGNNDPLKQILYCFRQNGGGGGPNPLLLNLVENLHNMESIDAIIVTPHWGVEYVQRPNRSQSELAEQLIGAGALAVIGSHPHVLQPWEKIINNGREGFVLYSLGNFVSNQSQIPRRASIILFLGLRKTSLGKVFIDGISYFPMYMRRRADKSNQKGYHYLTPLDTIELVDDIGSMARKNIYSIFPESYAIKNRESIIINGSQCH